MKKLVFTILLFLLFIPNIVNAAIARDASSGVVNVGTLGTSYTVAFTVTGSNPVLFVNINSRQDYLTGITYNGDAMTLIKKQTNLDSRFTYVYGLLNPDTGTHNVVASFSSSATNGYYAAVSYTGVAQTGLPDAVVGSNITVQNPCTQTLTTVANNAAAILFTYDNKGTGVTAGTNSTEISYNNGIGYYESSSLSITPAGSYSMSVKYSTTFNATMIMVSFAPYADAPPPSGDAVPLNNIIIFE